MPAASVDRLRGARLEWSEDGGGGLVLVNPNAPTPEEITPGVPPDVLASASPGHWPAGRRGPRAAVNPAIASHGGRADLVALERGGRLAYLRLSGGCQGCAMSQMTLSQGIETSCSKRCPS